LPDDNVLSNYDHVRSPDDICRSPDGFVLLTFDHRRSVYGRCRSACDRCKLPFSLKTTDFRNFRLKNGNFMRQRRYGNQPGVGSSRRSCAKADASPTPGKHPTI
jgi:hypothetical protein